MFSICGKLVGHLPVSGWLRAATGVLKRRATVVTKGWDNIVDDDSLKQMMAETLTRVRRSDPAQGEWHVSGHELNAWVDASSLATSVVLERFGPVLEDVCCFIQKMMLSISIWRNLMPC